MKTLLAISGLVVLLCCSPVAAGASADGKSNRMASYPTARYQVVSHHERSITLALPDPSLFDEGTFDLDVTYEQRVVATGEDGTVTLELRPIKETHRQKTGDLLEALPGFDGVLWDTRRTGSAHLPVYSATVSPTGALLRFSDIRYAGPVLGVMDPDIVPLYNWFVGFSGYPDGELKDGDSWGRRVNVLFDGVGTFEVTSSSKVVRFETMAGHRCAVVKSQISLPVGAMTAAMFHEEGATERGSGEVVISTVNYVDAVGRILIRSEGSFRARTKSTVSCRTESGEEDHLTLVYEASGSIEVSGGVMATSSSPAPKQTPCPRPGPGPSSSPCPQ